MEQDTKATRCCAKLSAIRLIIRIGTIRKVMEEHYTLLAIVTFLGACSIHSTGVVPNGEDRYKVTHLNGSASVSTDSLTADAINEANAYCRQNQSELKVTNSKETHLGSLGQWAESEVEFICE